MIYKRDLREKFLDSYFYLSKKLITLMEYETSREIERMCYK